MIQSPKMLRVEPQFLQRIRQSAFRRLVRLQVLEGALRCDNVRLDGPLQTRERARILLDRRPVRNPREPEGLEVRKIMRVVRLILLDVECVLQQMYALDGDRLHHRERHSVVAPAFGYNQSFEATEVHEQDAQVHIY